MALLRIAILFALVGAWGSGCRAHSRAKPAREASPALAYERLREGNLEEAAALFSEVVASEPGNRQARLELAYLSVRMKQWREAVKHLGMALDEDPGNRRLRMELGYAHRAQGNAEAAADDFRIVLSQPGEFEEQARAALKEVLEITADAAHGIRRDSLLNEGYAALREGQRDMAREKFKQVLVENPHKGEVLKQLGYMNIKEGNLSAAAANFESFHHLFPRDYEAALQLGYIYDGLHNKAKAEAAFLAALPSADKKIHDAAGKALKSTRSSRQRLYLDFYASPYYSTRFSNAIAFVEGELGFKPGEDGPLSLYLGGRYSQDSKSRLGSEPQIYADNAVSVGPGIRFQPLGWSAALSAEAAVAFNLMKTADHPRDTESDYRVSLADFHHWEGRFRSFSDLGLSAGYFSRYQDNIIGTLQLRAGFKVLEGDNSSLSLYVPFNVLKDKNKDFYNNIAEGGGGAELQPYTRINLTLRAEYFRGNYFGIEGRDRNPYQRGYDDFRVTMICFGRFGLGGRAASRQAKASPQEGKPFRAIRGGSYLW